MVLGPEHDGIASETPERKPPRRASFGVLLILVGMGITVAWIGLLLWAVIRLIVMMV